MTTPEQAEPLQQHCDQEEATTQQEEQATTTLTAQYVRCARAQFHAYCQQQHPSLREALAQMTVIAHETVARMTVAHALALLQEHPRWITSYPLDRYADSSSFDNRFTILDLVRRHLELSLAEEMGRHWQEERT